MGGLLLWKACVYLSTTRRSPPVVEQLVKLRFHVSIAACRLCTQSKLLWLNIRTSTRVSTAATWRWDYRMHVERKQLRIIIAGTQRVWGRGRFMWKRWCLKDDIFYSAFKLQLNVTSSAFRTKLVQDSFFHTGFATPNIYYKWRSPSIYFPLSVAERPCQTVCFERTRICWNSRKTLSVTDVTIMPRTFHRGSAVAQCVGHPPAIPSPLTMDTSHKQWKLCSPDVDSSPKVRFLTSNIPAVA